ncbi:MAG: hypothetical protein MUF18_09690 [Fimbriiglobus sp.]|jgi:hypothetical protein|nr:hypothetical protein [Fimbriiglobus sp.]
MTDIRHRTTLGSTFRFAVRLLGLAGVLTAAIGGLIAYVQTDGSLTDEAGDPVARIGRLMVVVGGAAAALWVFVELVGGLFLVAGRKSAEGVATGVLGLLAVVAVVVVNLASVTFYTRYDATRDRRFTLDRELIDELKKLDPNTTTTVLVLQLDKTSTFDPDQPDAITAAAQQKITEKVTDLIDELRQHPELSARFDVRVLSRRDERFEEQLATATHDKPELAAAVQAAPESSIFFASNGRVRRMPFSYFYLLDKTASRGKEAVGGLANPAAANLVLAPQGKERFVRALVGLEQRKPKVGLLTIHPYLTSQDADDDGRAPYTAAGLRAALEQNGCEVADVVLKKGWGRGRPQPSAGTFDESKLEEKESEYLGATGQALQADLRLQEVEAMREWLKTAPVAAVEQRFRRYPRGSMADAEYRTKLDTVVLDPTVRQLKLDAEDARRRAAEAEPEYRQLLADDRIQADRRAADVTAKLRAATADCDLLVIPRLTTMSLVIGQVIPPSLYPLAESQTVVVKEFLASGKPVLFAFGPTVDAGGFGPATDANEILLQRLGFELGSQTVITTPEAVAMTRPATLGNRSVKLPPLEVVMAGNTVAAAFDRANRSVDGTLELKRSGYRPIYLAQRDRPFTAPAVVLQTTADAWNESRPLAEEADDGPRSRSYYPKFEAALPDDPAKGTREEERKQRFVVGAAAEVPVPAEWIDPKAAALQAAAVMAGGVVGLPPGVASAVMTPDAFADKPSARTARVAVFGHGGFFVGQKLDPGQEALLISTVNWQLRRDDQLPKPVADAEKWRYPRVSLDDKQRQYWQVAGAAGLPLLAAFFGVVALMFRRRR